MLRRVEYETEVALNAAYDSQRLSLRGDRMPIFEISEDSFRAVEQTNFATAGLKERADLQRLLRDQIEVVAPGVLVIAEEFGEWTESRRRIDLLGIDKDANLVVIELKRSDDGGHMELQALRYSAMVSTLTAERAGEIFGTYLHSRGRDDDPEQLILDFLEWTEIDEDSFAQDVRIVACIGRFFQGADHGCDMAQREGGRCSLRSH